jgi:hypothetical protein
MNLNFFLKKVLVFSLSTILFFFMLSQLKEYFIKTKQQSFSSNLIIGDSHSFYGIQSEILGYQNISSHGEPIILSFLKLKTLLKKNVKINNVILGIGPHSFSQFQDKKFKDPRWSVGLISGLEYLDINSKNKRDLNVNDYDFFYNKIRKRINILDRDYYPFKLITEIKDKTIMPSEKIIEHALYRTSIHFSEGNSTPISYKQVRYLDSINSLAKSKNIRLIILGIPLSYDYIKHTPTKFLDLIDSVEIKNNIKVNNHFKMFNENKMFKDSDHLNQFGSKEFTDFLNNYLNKKELYE